MPDEKIKPRLEDLPYGFKSQTFVRNFSKLHRIDNIFRKTTVAEKLNQQLVLSWKFKDKVLPELHD